VLMGSGTAPDVASVSVGCTHGGMVSAHRYRRCAAGVDAGRGAASLDCQPSKAGHGGLSSGRVTPTSISPVDADELLCQAIATSGPFTATLVTFSAALTSFAFSSGVAP